MKPTEIKLARQCMNFQDIRCDNKECKNESCPLNQKYDSNCAGKSKRLKPSRQNTPY